MLEAVRIQADEATLRGRFPLMHNGRSLVDIRQAGHYSKAGTPWRSVSGFWGSRSERHLLLPPSAVACRALVCRCPPGAPHPATPSRTAAGRAAANAPAEEESSMRTAGVGKVDAWLQKQVPHQASTRSCSAPCAADTTALCEGRSASSVDDKVVSAVHGGSI